MKDFIMSALPFVIAGVCLAVICANFPKKDSEEKTKNFLLEGMCIGMCLGISIAELMNISNGLGISLGMLIGETVGVLIKKQKK